MAPIILQVFIAVAQALVLAAASAMNEENKRKDQAITALQELDSCKPESFILTSVLFRKQWVHKFMEQH